MCSIAEIHTARHQNHAQSRKDRRAGGYQALPDLSSTRCFISKSLLAPEKSWQEGCCTLDPSRDCCFVQCALCQTGQSQLGGSRQGRWTRQKGKTVSRYLRGSSTEQLKATPYSPVSTGSNAISRRIWRIESGLAEA